MKKCFSLLIGVLVLILSANAQDSEAAKKVQQITNKIDVYYFHGDRRCKTCKAVGSVSKEYLESNYAKEMEAGIINFHDVNFDQEEHKILAEKMEVSGSSLLIKCTKGTLVRVENITNQAFMYAVVNPKKLEELIAKEIEQTI